MRSAEAHARFGHPTPAVGPRRGERDPEIRDLGVTSVEQDIFGLDVAVDDAVFVGVLQRVRHLRGDSHRVVHRQLMLPRQPIPQALPFHVWHDVVDQPVRLAGVEQREDVWVLQIRRGLDLGQEPLGAEDGAQLRPQHLERDLPVVPQVVGEVDGGHAALPQLPLEAVAVGEGAGEAIRDLSHGGGI